MLTCRMEQLSYNYRCGQGLGCSDVNERSPIFLQWLDCVHQVNGVGRGGAISNMPSIFLAAATVSLSF